MGAGNVPQIGPDGLRVTGRSPLLRTPGIPWDPRRTGACRQGNYLQANTAGPAVEEEVSMLGFG